MCFYFVCFNFSGPILNNIRISYNDPSPLFLYPSFKKLQMTSCSQYHCLFLWQNIFLHFVSSNVNFISFLVLEFFISCVCSVKSFLSSFSFLNSSLTTEIFSHFDSEKKMYYVVYLWFLGELFAHTFITLGLR